MLRFARYLLVTALMISIGAQWALLQSAAWIGMAVTYTIKAGSVSEGLSQTFDGEHPCKLCCLVKKGSESEKKSPKQGNAKQKIELFAHERVLIVIASPARSTNFASADKMGVRYCHAPPTPPPRSSMA